MRRFRGAFCGEMRGGAFLFAEIQVPCGCVKLARYEQLGYVEPSMPYRLSVPGHDYAT